MSCSINFTRLISNHYFSQDVGVSESLQSTLPPGGEDEAGPHYVKLRGLPYETNVGEIFEFLQGCQVKGGENGIHMLLAPDNRPKGEALVELETNKDMVNALNKDRQHMGQRYVEVMFVNKEQFETEMNRQPGTVGLEGGGGGMSRVATTKSVP